MEYTIKYSEKTPILSNDWDASDWADITPLDISHFRPESSMHRPITHLKLKYNEENLFGLFKVDDQFVRCVSRGYQVNVCRDSCVECFMKPKADKGYFNFEFNCGGAILCSYVEDHTRTDKGFKKYTKLDVDDLKQVEVYHTMPEIVYPEIMDRVEWFLGFKIPLSIMEKYCGDLGTLSKQKWTANFYKCGDLTSHPHWASWKPVKEVNFHAPDTFGPLVFE